MINKIILAFLIAVFVVTGFSQTKRKSVHKKTVKTSVCELTEAPEIRGFFLGQTFEEITKLVPDFREAYEYQRNGNRNFTLNLRDINSEISNELQLIHIFSSNAFGNDSDRELLKSVDYEDVRVSWSLWEKRLYEYSILYDEFEIEQNAAKFIKQVSAKTILPQKGWIINTNSMEAELKCDGFKVYLNAGYRMPPTLAFTDTKAEAEIIRLEKEIKLRKKKEELERIRLEKEKRETFKP